MADDPSGMTLEGLAAEISARLRALEADTAWNRQAHTGRDGRPSSHARLYNAGASPRRGGKVQVTCVSFQGSHDLERGQAEDYLAWLQAGSRGTHHDAQADGAIRPSRAEAERAAQEVAFRGPGGPVYSRVAVPDGAKAAPARAIAAGQRVYWEGAWRKVEAVTPFTPPEHAAVAAAAASARDAADRGEYEAVALRARELASLASQLASGRTPEVQLCLAGRRDVRLTPECLVAARDA